jgi:hypothetical protein
MLTTRDRTDELRELEELWEAPAAPEPARAHPGWPQARPPRIAGAYLAWAWAVFLFAAVALAPPSEPHATTPLWADAVAGSMFLLLAGAALAGRLFGRVGFAAATMAGGLGIATAVACRATEHHLGNWWLVELGAMAVLTGVAAAGLAERLRRQ